MIYLNQDDRFSGLTPRAPQTPQTPPSQPGPSIPDTFGAAFGLENPTLNAVDLLSRKPFEPTPGYNPLDDIKGTRYESEYLDNFVGSVSRDNTLDIMSRIDREEQQRDTLARSGLTGWIAAMAAGALDPTVFIPVAGWISRGAGMARAGRGVIAAGEAAAATAGAVALQEGVLQAAQETRTAEESAWAIGGAALLGGVLGGAAGLMTRGAVDAAAGRIGSEMFATDVGAGGAAGAQVSAAGRGSGKLANTFGAAEAMSPINPSLRTETSPITATRNTVRDLIAGDRLAENELGIASSEGGSVEVRVALAEGAKATTWERYRQLYSDYAFGKQVTAPAIRAGVGRLFGLQNKMSYYEFVRAVTEAAAHGDEHIIPQVAEAAKARRAAFVNPLRDEAANVVPGFRDLLELATADESYLTRIWNRTAVKQGFTELRDLLARHFEDQQNLWIRSAEKTGKEYGGEVLSKNEIRAVAEDTVQNILGMSPGRIAMPGEFNVGVRGPLKERMLRTLPTQDVWKFVERDIEAIDSAYVKSMATDIAMVKKFGSVDMKAQIQAINDEAARMVEGKPPAQQKKIFDRAKADIRDLTAMRDVIRGTYKLPDNPDGLLHRSVAVGKTLNFLSSLGMMTVSSVSDIGKPIMAHGLARSMAVPFKALTGGLKTLKLAARDVRLAGQAIDMITNDRAISFAELVDQSAGRTAFERGVQQAGRAFSFLTLMAPWNTVMKQWAGITAMTRALKSIDALVKGGKLSKNEIAWLAENGVDANAAGRIAAQFEKHGVKDGEVWVAQMEKWTDKQAKDALRALVNRDVDRVIVTPGAGDKPLVLHGDLGSVLGQFQSFAISSVQRTLLSGLAQRDMAVMNGLMVMLALGAVSYWLKSTIGGYEVSDNPRVWAAEAVDNSGVLGILMNANHAIEKLTSDRFGISALTGEPARRYVNVNKMGAFLGPSFGKASDALDIVDAISNFGRVNSDGSTRTLTQSDIHKIRKFIPLQNLFIVRRGFDAIENGVNQAFSIPERQGR